MQVCAAVQYAHQRLIIHRDIKPGNILVTADGTPKLLDFGIAKIVAFEPSPAVPDATATVLRALTPHYASPEQINGETMTTASDVYSLGVVLYELLSGRSPHGLVKGTPRKIGDTVRTYEPQRASLAVLQTGEPDDLRELSAVRDSTPQKLSQQLRGDLDNIILMALRKEPQRRYSSVERFAEDIRRHLENLPVIARKDTARYRAWKFIVRYKTGRSQLPRLLQC